MPLAPDAQQRLDALRRFLVVDAPEEDELARLVRVAATVYGVEYAVLSIREPAAEGDGAETSEGPYRVAAAFGTDADEFGADDTLIDLKDAPILPMAVNDASEDKRFEHNPLVRAGKARFYAAVPLKSGHGFTIGTLALLDPEPQELNGDGLSLLVDIGALVEPVLNQREFQRERNAAVAVREAASFEAATMATERDAARDERDSALQERSAALAELEKACAERDALVVERDAALESSTSLEAGTASLVAERDAAVVERDAAIAERDAAAAEQGRLVAELEAMRAERETSSGDVAAARADFDALRSEVEIIRSERDSAIADRDALAITVRTANAERDAARAELESVTRARDSALSERDAARTERDAALVQRGTDADEQRASIAERDAARAERDAATAELDSLRRELVGLQTALETTRQEADSSSQQLEAARAELAAGATLLATSREETAAHARDLDSAREEHAAALRALDTARREHSEAIRSLEATASASREAGSDAGEGARWAEFVEVAPVPLVAAARDGTLLLANGRARMLLGLTEASGEALESIVAAGEMERLQPLLRQPETRPVEIGIRDATGSVRPVRVSVAAAPAAGDGAVLLAIRTLETERRLTEALREREAALTEASAPPAPQPADPLMATVHNEVINALRALSEYAALQQARDVDNELREMAGAVNGVSGRLLRILEGTFDVAGVGAAASGLSPVELGPLVEAASKSYREAAEARDLAFVVDAPADGTAAWAEPGALGHVIDALLSNAVAHTVRGGIRVRVAVEDDRAYVEVQDTGVGVDSKTLADALIGSAAGVTRPGGGVGLGLALARRMADRMGGELTGRSVPGQGSVFRLQLRAAPPADAAPGGDGVATAAVAAG